MNKVIYLAGGCFWGVEAYFASIFGVESTVVGYANGNIENPTYPQVKTGTTGFAETVKIEYNSNLFIEHILEHYLRFVDPYSINKQGEDVGSQYRTGVYYVDEETKDRVLKYFKEHLKEDYKIEVLPLKNFYEAETYHQEYLKKNPGGYCHVDLSLIKFYEKKEVSFERIAVLAADLYEKMPDEQFTSLDSLTNDIANTVFQRFSIDDLYDILPLFMSEVNKRGIPLVMYKIPGPYNEPIFQSFRKIAEKSGYRYPSTSYNLNKPKTVDEIIKDSKNDKKDED